MESSSTPRFTKPTAFLKNVSYDATEADIEKLFNGLSISSIKMSRDARSGQPKGMVHVEFNDQESLDKAVTLTGTSLNGRNVTIEVAKQMEKKSSSFNEGAGAFSSGGGGRFQGSFQSSSSSSDPHPLTAYVSGLANGTTEGDIETLFAGIKVVKTKFYHDKETGEFKGVAFVEFANTNDLDAAVSRNGNIVNGAAANISISGKRQKNIRPYQSGGYNNNNRQNNNFNNNNNNNNNFGNRSGARSNYSRTQDPEAFAAFNTGKGRKQGTHGQKQFNAENHDQHQQQTAQSSPQPATTESTESTASRPKLQLAPRSVEAPLNAAATSAKNNPFGNAKPIDTASVYLKKNPSSTESPATTTSSVAAPASSTSRSNQA